MVLTLVGVVFFFLPSCANVEIWKLITALSCLVFFSLICSDTADLALGCHSFTWRFFFSKLSPWVFFPFFIVLKIIVHFIIGGALNLMNYVIKAQEILAIVIYDHFCSGPCGALARLPSPAPTWFKCFPDTPRRWPQGWPSATDWQINVCYGMNCSPPSKFIQWSPNPSTSEYDYICRQAL